MLLPGQRDQLGSEPVARGSLVGDLDPGRTGNLCHGRGRLGAIGTARKQHAERYAGGKNGNSVERHSGVRRHVSHRKGRTIGLRVYETRKRSAVRMPLTVENICIAPFIMDGSML